jgi:glycerate 2-kinase
MNNRELTEHIFLAGIKGVLPGKLINNLFSVRGQNLKIGYHTFDLEKTGSIYVIGAGKASAAMAHYVEKFLGGRITGGHIVTKYGYYCSLENIAVTEAGHPVPDENSYKATAEIIQIADKASENDLVICLWSGGGSSLLADFPDSSSPEEARIMNDMLVRSGADIREINTIRKHLSHIKGGQLARHIWPASSISIMLSDVTGDPPDIISSGPTVPDSSTFSDALMALEKYQLRNQLPYSLLNYLEEGARGMKPETPEMDDTIFSKTLSILAANNKTALQAAMADAEKRGMHAIIVASDIMGDINQVSEGMIDAINSFRNNNEIPKPVCLLFGGETTVKVSGEGLGGRNQHLTLTMAKKVQEIPGVTFLAGSTDGNDGNTEMAGAVIDSETIHNALSMNIDPGRYLEEFNSYNFFKTVGGHVYTGPTLTNVMDMVVVIIE